MKRIDLYLTQAISIKGENGTSYEQVTHIDTTHEGDEYIEDENGEILYFNEMDATMRLNALEAIEQALEAIVTMTDNKPVEPEKKSTEIKVLYAVDSEDNTKQAICATSEANWQDGSKREAIDKAVRGFLGDILTEYIEDPYEAHINDKSEDEKKAEFADTINKLASGQDSEFLWYELFWRSVPTL